MEAALSHSLVQALLKVGRATLVQPSLLNAPETFNGLAGVGQTKRHRAREEQAPQAEHTPRP